jgi:hypothetical protein
MQVVLATDSQRSNACNSGIEMVASDAAWMLKDASFILTTERSESAYVYDLYSRTESLTKHLNVSNAKEKNTYFLLSKFQCNMFVIEGRTCRRPQGPYEVGG